MAATIAGIQFIPGFDGASDMFSVLGLSGDQNSTTFNGLGSGISALPPDFLATTSIHPYPFDPAYGGFSGAQVSIQTLPGTNFSRRSMTNGDIAPSLEWADATADALDQRFTTMRLGGNAAGPISPDQAFYNVAYNYQRRFSAARSLVNTSPAGLAAAGVAPDSVTRFLAIAQQEGVPLSAAGMPTLATLDQAQVAANFDLMPSESGAGHSFVLGTAASFQRARPVTFGGLLYATPTHGRRHELLERERRTRALELLLVRHPRENDIRLRVVVAIDRAVRDSARRARDRQFGARRRQFGGESVVLRRQRSHGPRCQSRASAQQSVELV